jgi:FRG domain
MKIDKEKTFIEIPYNSAAEFLGALLRTNEYFASAEDTLLYRGESDISRDLIPTAFRESGMKSLIDLNQIETSGTFKKCTDITQNLGRWFHETMAIAMFYKHANEQSLLLPALPPDVHLELIRRTNTQIGDYWRPSHWPRKELWPIMALAQHYGFPTRLLDWSGDPLASAYFAAKGGMKYLHETDRKIGVWRTSTSVLQRTALPYFDKKLSINQYITIIDTLYAGNPNLSAQKGRFTLAVEKSDIFNETSAIHKSLDVIFQDICLQCEKQNSLPMLLLPDDYQSSNAFYKFTLPVSQSADLLNRLHQLGYKASKLFPGYSACIETVNELLKIREFVDYPPQY